MTSMAPNSDLKWTAHNPCSFPAGGGIQHGGMECGDHGFYPHMNHAAAAVTAARDFQHSFLGASPMSHFAAVATDTSHVAAAEGKSTMTIS